MPDSEPPQTTGAVGTSARIPDPAAAAGRPPRQDRNHAEIPVIRGPHPGEVDDTANVRADGKLVLGAKFRIIGGHALCIVGYSGATEEFKFANMWGETWGEKGFGYISREDLERIIQGAATLRL